jgi:hypothetical protein
MCLRGEASAGIPEIDSCLLSSRSGTMDNHDVLDTPVVTRANLDRTHFVTRCPQERIAPKDVLGKRDPFADRAVTAQRHSDKNDAGNSGEPHLSRAHFLPLNRVVTSRAFFDLALLPACCSSCSARYVGTGLSPALFVSHSWVGSVTRRAMSFFPRLWASPSPMVLVQFAIR